MNLITFNRRVVDEVEKITDTIKWSEIMAIKTLVTNTDPFSIKKAFLIALGSEHCSVNYALTEIQIETASLPIVEYAVGRLFEQLRLAEKNRAEEKHG